MKTLLTVTHRHITAEHFLEDSKYKIWYHLEGQPLKSIGILEVRGLKEPLTEEELKKHIDKRWEEYYERKNFR